MYTTCRKYQKDLARCEKNEREIEVMKYSYNKD